MFVLLFLVVLLCFVIHADMVVPSAETTSTSLWVLVIRVFISTTPCVHIMYWFLFCCRLSTEWVYLLKARLCLVPFSRRIAYPTASCGVRVCANCSSAVFSVIMCAVNMSPTHSSSLSPQSALRLLRLHLQEIVQDSPISLFTANNVISFEGINSVSNKDIFQCCHKFLCGYIV